MALSRVAFSSLRIGAPAFVRPLSASNVMNTRFAASAPAAHVPGKPMGAHSLHFKIERYFAAGMVPILPAAYFIHGPVMDAVLTAALVLHIHWGVVAVVNDYGRPIVIGQTAARLAVPAAYILSFMLLAGLLHFNTNDVGITKAFEMVFSL